MTASGARAATQYALPPGAQVADPKTGRMTQGLYNVLLVVARRLGYGTRPNPQTVAVGASPWAFAAPDVGALAVQPGAYQVSLVRNGTAAIPVSDRGGMIQMAKDDIVQVTWDATTLATPNVFWFPYV